MPLKTVSVSTILNEGMRIECRAGKHSLIIDQPSAAGGTDTGPTPLEYYELALAGCVSSIARIVAKQKGITLRSMNVDVSGEIDTDVLLGKSQSVRAGFKSFTITVQMDADLDATQKREFIEEVERRCPVSENTSNPTPVSLVIR